MRLFAQHAWLETGFATDVLIEVVDGRFSTVQTGADSAGAQRLRGVVLPGFANAHSHAFHRALRGRTHDGPGSFWTWRDQMYALAGTLNPDQYLALATATYVEMALAGITSVGEFHYLHHAPGGRAYAEKNIMGHALAEAARAAGIRLTLLDACYLSGGLTAEGHLRLDAVQQRFSDTTVESWAARVAELQDGDGLIIGSAIHSVRAVSRQDLAVVAATRSEGPLHIHVSEQPAENEACQDFYGVSPVQLLAAESVLSARTTAVHATHLTVEDIGLLGRSGTGACFCPTTERDLADGIGPSAALARAGVSLSLGSDQHAVIDLIEEARALEMHERLAGLQRGCFTAAQLLSALSTNGHRALGWPDAGAIAPGARADLVAIRLDSVRTAGVDPRQVLMAASAADVDTVMVDGRLIVQAGQHLLGDVGPMLAQAIEPLWAGR